MRSQTWKRNSGEHEYGFSCVPFFPVHVNEKKENNDYGNDDDDDDDEQSARRMHALCSRGETRLEGTNRSDVLRGRIK